jgi:Putative transmembrane protein (PGPGW)
MKTLELQRPADPVPLLCGSKRPRATTSRKARLSWRLFRADLPGRRFSNLYRRHQKSHTRNPIIRRGFMITGGVLIVIAGLILMPAPGPGIAVVILGIAFLAAEIRKIAYWLDAMELRVRGKKKDS